MYGGKKLKNLNDLTEFEQFVLLVCCIANKFSLSSHVPQEAVIKRIRNIDGKMIKKALKSLKSNDFIGLHPTKGGLTIQLTRKGLEAGNILKEER